MVSLTQRDEFMLDVQQDAELRELRAFVFRDGTPLPISGATTRAKLFNALAADDSPVFQEHVRELATRNVSTTSDWIGDDCIVFLLLLGAARYAVGHSLIERVLQCRTAASSPQTQRINATFEAIYRRELAIEGEYGFIKAVFLDLSGNLKLSRSDRVRLYKQLTSPAAFRNLSTFFQLLAIRAFDLVIENHELGDDERSWEQILAKLQDEGGKLSLGQFVRLLKHVRISAIISIVAFISSIFLLGRGCGWLTQRNNSPSDSLAATNTLKLP